MRNKTNDALALLEIADTTIENEVFGYGLLETRECRILVALEEDEYPPKDMSAFTRSRESALLWLCEESIVDRLESAVRAYDEAEREHQNDLQKLDLIMQAADLVIDLARKFTEQPQEISIYEKEED